MKIYTKTGDKGTTCLVGGERVAKFDERVEAYGTVDELMAHIALLSDYMEGVESLEPYRKQLCAINHHLMNASAVLAVGAGCTKEIPDISPAAIEELERNIDQIDATLPPLDKFTLPGGHIAVSQCNLCRTVCRRAERAATKAASLHKVPEDTMSYINRLSDYLYTLTRKLIDTFNVKEICWVLEK